MAGGTAKQAGEEIGLIAVDLDGTLLTSERTLALAGGRLLTQAAARGVRVVLATTRHVENVGEYCRELQLQDPLICSNGAVVLAAPGGPVWASHQLPLELALAVARLADDAGWELSTTVGGMVFLRQRPGQELGLLRPGVTVVPDNSAALDEAPISFLTWQPEAISAIRALCREEFADLCCVETYCRPDGGEHSLGVFPLRGNKGDALRLVLERLQIRPEQALAIGDNENDLPMFAVAGTSVAMGNALAKVRQAATVVAPTNDEEGVAWAVRRFVLEG